MIIKKTTNVSLLNSLDRKLFADEAELLELDGHVWWVVICDDKIAGYAGLKLKDEGCNYGYLSRAGVLPEFRGRGIQRQLIKVRDTEAMKRGYALNITYTANWNHASANNLIREGYTLYEPQWKYGLKNALYFWKHFKR